MGQIANKLYKSMLVLFAIGLGLVLLVCIPDTQHNLPAGKMILLPLVWTAVLTAIYLGGMRIKGFLEKYHRILLPVFLAAYGLGLFALCVADGTKPQGDWGSVVQGAEYMAGLSENSNWEYFARCKNNTVPMLVIAQELKLGKLLGLENPHWAGMFFNVVQVTVTLACTYYVCRKAHNDSCVTGWLGMGMLAVTLPVVGQSRVLYTDSLSLSLGILGFVVWMKADEGGRRGVPYWLKLTGAGLIWGVGCALKLTVVICVIAVLLFVFLFRRDRSVWKNCVMAAMVAASIWASGAWADTWLDPELVEAVGQPRFTYWIAIGLKGGGDWVSGGEYVEGMMSLYGMEAREEYTGRYIRENIGEFLNPSHLAAKAKTNFAVGSMGSSDFMTSEKPGKDFVWEWVSRDGAYFWRYNMICTSYFYFVLLMVIFCCIRECGREGPASPGVFVPVVTCLGMVVYLMVFEANNRQLYNEFMWFICSAVNGIVMIPHLFRKTGNC